MFSSKIFRSLSKNKCYGLINVPLRKISYSHVTQEDKVFFNNILGERGLVLEKHELNKYNCDWTGRFKGNSDLVLLPKTADEVSKILSYCNSRKLAVVPQGGNTGLVGGGVPIKDEIIISTSRMNKILNFEHNSGIVTCQSGVILSNLNDYLELKGHIVPLDLAAKGSCQIGGNVATNAGGIRYIRYGSLHGNVTNLRVVLADGTILNCGNDYIRKDNTGYDLKQLFIGSEGTLGIITDVSILCPTKPSSVNVLLLGVNNYHALTEILHKAKFELNEILSACEFFDRDCLNLVLEQFDNLNDPFFDKHRFYLLIETSGSTIEHDLSKIEKFMDVLTDNRLIDDGVLAHAHKQYQSIWALRENISEALSRSKHINNYSLYKYDLSLQIPNMYPLVEDISKIIKHEGVKLYGYGHIGDGNLHLNILSSNPKFNIYDIESQIYGMINNLKGSISAEHGVGQLKAHDILCSKNTSNIGLMSQIKRVFDPNYILNPNKVIVNP